MIESLSTEQALILGLAGLVALVLAVAKMRFALLFMGGMLFVSALGVPLDWGKNVIRLWILPLQAQRSIVYVGCAALLLLAACVHVGRLTFRQVSTPGLLIFLLGVYAGLVRMMSGNAPEGMQSIAFAALTIPVLLVMIPSLVHKPDDLYAALRMVAVVSAVWVGCVMFQFAIDWKKLVVQHGLSRFHGLLANPQHAAVFLSVASVTCLFLGLNDPKIRYRLVWSALAGVNAILVLWTGSRTGLGMLGIGLTASLYARVGRAILFLPVVGLVGMLAFNLLAAGGMEIDVKGFSARGENRSQAWMALLHQIGENPVLGIGEPKDIPSENSYLFAMASYGLGMGAIIALLMLACGVQSLRLWRRKHLMAPRERRLADLIMGFYAMYFGGAMFEGYIIARVSTQLMFMALFSSLGTALLHLTRQAPALPEAEAEEYAEGYEEGGEGETWDDSGSRAPTAA